jgi:hypothetical protein
LLKQIGGVAFNVLENTTIKEMIQHLREVMRCNPITPKHPYSSGHMAISGALDYVHPMVEQKEIPMAHMLTILLPLLRVSRLFSIMQQ